MRRVRSAQVEQGTDSPDPLAVRRRFGGHLWGEGIEIGPGHVPFPVPDTVAVRYVDRWEPDVNRALFPELGDAPGFPKPDIVANLDADRLTAIGDGSQDFVIASHVIEHLANPLAMLLEIYRVLRKGALLVLLVPDRHKTFDRDRQPTSLSHVIDEYRDDIRTVDDAHILDFIRGTSALRTVDDGVEIANPELMSDEIGIHRQRSVHAHVWDLDEFSEMMTYAATNLGVRWRVVDTMPPGAEGTHGDEFGWVLARR